MDGMKLEKFKAETLVYMCTKSHPLTSREKISRLNSYLLPNPVKHPRCMAASARILAVELRNVVHKSPKILFSVLEAASSPLRQLARD